VSDVFDEDSTEPDSVTFTADRPDGLTLLERPEMRDLLAEMGVAEDEPEMVASIRFIELRVTGVEPALAALEVGWSLRELRKRQADPYYADVLAEVLLQQNESVESVLYRKALGGNMEAMKLWLYNRAANDWKDVRRIVDERHDDPVEHVAASVTAGILDAVRLLGVRDMQAALAPGVVIETTVSDDADRSETS
jgi:hypothetical protein